jgi:hypothetical protein
MNSETEEIDVTKTLIFLLVSLFITLLITAFMIIPDIKVLKIKKIEAERAVRAYKENSHYKQSLQTNLQTLKKTNANTLSMLNDGPSKLPFDKLSSKLMGDLHILHQEVRLEENQTTFKVTDYNATTLISEPRNFYKFIDTLKEADNMIEIGFPISMEVKDDYQLDISFKMTRYDTLARKSKSVSEE